MCYSCYEEAGKPVIINDKTKEAARLVKFLYEETECRTGGYAHIVTDDWNLKDGDIDWCITEAEKNTLLKKMSEEGRIASLNVLKAFKELSEDERYSALAIREGFTLLD